MSADHRLLLDRAFGYSEPVPGPEGEIAYRCAFCDAPSAGSEATHAVDCSYWSVASLLAGPLGQNIIARWAASPAVTGPPPEWHPET